ncbi:MAG: hypothetical protein P4L41_13445 [Flavipsychrobacter sp.]|nr:hypothetical protein [Flavipsychrobacter sp.]
MLKNIFVLTTFVCLVVACSKNTNNIAPTDSIQSLLNDTTGPVVTIDSMPLTVGNSWTYTSGTDTYMIKVTADTTINGARAAKVSTFKDGAISTAYYTNKSDGYYLVAKEYANPDSLAILATPVRRLAFPNVLNDSWSTADSLGYPPTLVNATSQWLDYDKVTTPAGVFNCCKLLYYSLNYGASTYNYYSTKGLVKQVTIASTSKGPGAGPYSFIAGTTTLIAVNF